MQPPEAKAPGIDLPLHYQQGQVITTHANEILFGGAAGGGKSHLLRAAATFYSLSIAGLQTYLFRRLSPDLRSNHMEGPSGFPNMLAPFVRAGYCQVLQQEIRWWNGSKIFLRHCQYESNLLNYQGVEIHLLLLDEATHFTEYMYRYLRGRCRLGGLKVPERFKGMFPRIIGGTNPGGIGHHSMKKSFVDHGTKAWKTPPSEGGMTRQFIPAQIADNPSLLENDPDYVDRLEGLGDASLVRAMKEGDWNVVAGSMYGDVWRNERHVINPFPIPKGWELWRGGDDGFSAPACALWFTKDPDAKTIYIIGEVYGPAMLPDEYAERTIARDLTIPLIDAWGDIIENPAKLSGLMDSGAFSDPGLDNAETSRGSQMNDKGTGWEPVDKGPGSRIIGAQNVHRVLGPNPKDPKGRPILQIFNTCENLIRTLPALPRHPRKPEDVDTNAEDHAYDALRYGLLWDGTYSATMRVR